MFYFHEFYKKGPIFQMERICVLIFIFLFLILCNQVVLDALYVSHSYFKDHLDSRQSVSI